MSDPENLGGKLHEITTVNLDFSLQALTIYESPVGTVQVADQQSGFGLQELGMVSRDAVGGDREGVVRFSADREDGGVNRKLPRRIAGGQLPSQIPFTGYRFALMGIGIRNHGAVEVGQEGELGVSGHW
jgi:hypothetical protein